MRLRVEKLELQISELEKRVWIIIVLFIISILLAKEGALKGILVGFSTLEVSNSMDPIIWFALVAGIGSGFRAFLGFLKAKEKGAVFEPKMFFVSFVPALVAGLSSSAYLGLGLNATNVVLVFFGAAGFNSLQDKFGLQIKSKK